MSGLRLTTKVAHSPLEAISPDNHSVNNRALTDFSQELEEKGLVLSDDCFVRRDQHNSGAVEV